MPGRGRHRHRHPVRSSTPRHWREPVPDARALLCNNFRRFPYSPGSSETRQHFVGLVLRPNMLGHEHRLEKGRRRYWRTGSTRTRVDQAPAVRLGRRTGFLRFSASCARTAGSQSDRTCVSNGNRLLRSFTRDSARGASPAIANARAASTWTA